LSIVVSLSDMSDAIASRRLFGQNTARAACPV
jgi:hypothetical protein